MTTTRAGMEHEPQAKADNAAQTSDGAAPAGVGARGQVQALLANGTREPQQYASVIRNHPASSGEIMSLLQQTIGHTAVRAIVQLLSPSPVRDGDQLVGDVRVNAPHGLRVRSSPDQNANNVVGMLADQTVVTTVSRAGEWLGIDHQGARGFINSGFVESAKVNAPLASSGQQEAHSASATPAPIPTPSAPAATQVANAPNEKNPANHPSMPAVATAGSEAQTAVPTHGVATSVPNTTQAPPTSASVERETEPPPHAPTSAGQAAHPPSRASAVSDPNVTDQMPAGHVEPVISRAPKPPARIDAPSHPSGEHASGGATGGTHSPEPATPARSAVAVAAVLTAERFRRDLTSTSLRTLAT